MRHITKRLLILSMVLMLGVAGSIAAPSVDSETTTTASTSDLTDGQTASTQFNASDTDQLPTLQASYATTKPEIQIIDPETGTTIETFTNESDPGYFTSTGGTGPYYYNTTFNESDFARVPMDSGENKSVTLRLIDNSSLDDPGSADMTNVTIYLENVDGRTVVRGSASAMDLESVGAGPLNVNPLDLFGEQQLATYEQSGVAINGSGSTVALTLTDETGDSNTSVQERFSQRASDAEAGDWILQQELYVDGNAHKVYYDEAPDTVADGATYGVYDPDTNEVTVFVGDEYDGQNSVDLTVGTNGYGLLTRVTEFGLQGVTASIPVVGSMAVAGAAVLLISRRPLWSREE